MRILLIISLSSTLIPSKPSGGHWLWVCVLFWIFRGRKYVGSRTRKKKQSCLSDKLKSSPGMDNIYSISLVLFPSFSVNPQFHINLLFTFVAGDLVSCYLSYILCMIIFQLQITAGRQDCFLAPLFITLCTWQFIFPDQVRVSDVQVSWFITVLRYFLSRVSSCSPAVVLSCVLVWEGFNCTVKALTQFISIIRCDYTVYCNHCWWYFCWSFLGWWPTAKDKHFLCCLVGWKKTLILVQVVWK